MAVVVCGLLALKRFFWDTSGALLALREGDLCPLLPCPALPCPALPCPAVPQLQSHFLRFTCALPRHSLAQVPRNTVVALQSLDCFE